MQDTRQKILMLLKMNGGMTTNDLSNTLRISATAARRHLSALEVQELVTHRSEQRGMGRPCFVYELAAGASNTFPSSYATFATSILQDLIDLDGGEKLDELFHRRQKKRRKLYTSQIEGETLSDRIACLAQLLESEGRMTTWEQRGKNHFVLREHNCPIHHIVKKFDHPCRGEISLLAETLQAQVKRIGRISDGDIACVYEIVLPKGDNSNKN